MCPALLKGREVQQTVRAALHSMDFSMGFWLGSAWRLACRAALTRRLLHFCKQRGSSLAAELSAKSSVECAGAKRQSENAVKKLSIGNDMLTLRRIPQLREASHRRSTTVTGCRRSAAPTRAKAGADRCGSSRWAPVPLQEAARPPSSPPHPPHNEDPYVQVEAASWDVRWAGCEGNRTIRGRL